jgi:16S rRNA (adenine1518-N6/adenine1519-N6)-dimethyltransferase
VTQIELVRKYGIRPVKRLGQNFLIDENIQRKILGALPLGSGRIFLEIGPGLGALTLPLLKRGERVLAVEFDKKLASALETELSPYLKGGLDLIQEDALRFLAPENLGRTLGGEKGILVGNLPYSISSPILFLLLELHEFFDGAYFMLQKEVIERLTARPGTPSYGRLSAGFGFFTKTTRLFDISPHCFYPKPEVWSSFVEIRFRENRLRTVEREDYLALIKLAFSERRKKLAGLLVRACGLSTAQAEDFMVRGGHSPNIRAEELSPIDFWQLLGHIRKFKKKEKCFDTPRTKE